MSELEQARKMSQYELELQLDRMTQRAFPNTLQRAPRKPLTVVDAEIIKEYQKQFNEPVKEYEMEIDPETGEERIATELDGSLKFKVYAKKYRVVPPPELDVVEDRLINIPKDEELATLELELVNVKEFIKGANQAIRKLQQERKDVLKAIDELPTPKKQMKGEYRSGIFVYRANPDYAEEVQDYNREKARLTRKIDEIVIELVESSEGLKDARDHYDKINLIGQRIKTDELLNNAQIAISKKINTERIQAYQDNLNRLNQGAFQQVQMPDETEDDYVNRLQANASEEVINESKFEATMDIKRRFKEALKQLVRSDSIIESVANKIPDEELGIKSEILKRFPLFKKKFVELYGINNKSVVIQDISNFIDAFMKSLEGDNMLLDYLRIVPTVEAKPQGMESQLIESRQDTGLTALQLAEQDKKKVYVIENPSNGRRVYFRVAIYINPEDEDMSEVHLIWSFTGKRDSYREFIPSDDDLSQADIILGRPNSFEEIKTAIKMNKGFIVSQFNRQPYSDKWITFLLTKIEPTSSLDVFDAKYEPDYEFDEKQYGSRMGWGVKADEIPELVNFGKIKLALHKLFYQNVLSIRHMNNGRIDGFNNVKVSDAMVAIIMKLAKGERVIKQEVDGLKKTEQMLYDTLLSLANLHKKTPNNKDATITSMKERMQLIGGEIEAGNDNRALVKELGTIVKALKSFGVISNKEAIKYLSQF